MCVSLPLCLYPHNGKVIKLLPLNPTKPKSNILPLSQFLDINFDYDSIKKQYTPSTVPAGGVTRTSPIPQPNPNPFPSSPLWTYDDRISDCSTGYQLTQLCCCYYTTVSSSDERTNGSHTPSPTVTTAATPSVFSVDKERVPVAVNGIQYSVDLGL